MQLITWLTPTGDVYQASSARSSADISVPDRPTDGKKYTYDRETGVWELIPPSVSEQIQEIQGRYVPRLLTLQTAFNGAQLTGDATDAEEIQAEYKSLVAQMDAEISEVENA